jgi:hypothetical protein
MSTLLQPHPIEIIPASTTARDASRRGGNGEQQIEVACRAEPGGGSKRPGIFQEKASFTRPVKNLGSRCWETELKLAP